MEESRRVHMLYRFMNIIPMTIIKTSYLLASKYHTYFIHRSDNSLSHYLEW